MDTVDTAQIENLAIITGKVVDGAITTSAAVNVPGDVNLPDSTTWITVASLVLNTTVGSSMFVLFTGEADPDVSSSASVEFRLVRGSIILVSLTRAGGIVNDRKEIIISGTDVVIAGAQTYKLEAKLVSGNPVDFRENTLFVLETKK